jgi:AbrB family looped-hinge helix DNA binding protein
MQATITSKGQITIPLALRQKFNLQPGDQLEFDENASVLTARRVVNQDAWHATVREWRNVAAKSLENHPWNDAKTVDLLDDLRGGPVDAAPNRP